MQNEPNWSRNVNLRAQAWELEEYNKNKQHKSRQPTWVRFDKTQQSLQPKTAHWVKQQNNIEHDQQNYDQSHNHDENLNENSKEIDYNQIQYQQNFNNLQHANNTSQNQKYIQQVIYHSNGNNDKQISEWNKELAKANFQPIYNNENDVNEPEYKTFSNKEQILEEENEENPVTATKTITTIQNNSNKKITQHPHENRKTNQSQQQQQYELQQHYHQNLQNYPFRHQQQHQVNSEPKISSQEQIINQFKIQQQPRIKINEFCS